jgi:Mrp family chromosome partitioning ATPase
METQGRNPGSPFFAEANPPRDPRTAGSESYGSAEQIAADLKTALLAEFRHETDVGRWEEDLSLLSETGWVGQCEKLVKRLVQLREASPLDVVAVCALTDGVPMKPFMYSLGIALRKLLQRVVLMDCDLRAPSLYAPADGRAVEGFIDMVKYGCSFFTVSRETEVSGLYVIGAGSHPVLSEGELVGKDLERAFNSLRTKSDVTLVCAPPFLPGGRVNPILGCVDGVLVCVNRPSAKKPGITGSFTRLWQSDVPVLGAVNHEPRDFEERKTIVLNVASHASEPELSLGDGAGTDAAEPARSRPEAQGTDAAHRIELEFTPECRPLLSEGEDSADSGGTFDSPVGTEAGVGIGGPSPGDAVDRSTGQPAKRRPWRRVRSVEERFLDRELFGRRRISSRLAFLIGLPAVLVVLVVAAVISPRLARAPGEQVDNDVMRSILLPGSDGIVGAGEVETALVAPALPDVPTSKAHTLGTATYYVHVSSHKMYESALRDSARVAGAGFRVSLQFVRLSELGQWYRVVAGPFHTTTAARAAAARIEPMGLAKQVRIIQEGVDQ